LRAQEPLRKREREVETDDELRVLRRFFEEMRDDLLAAPASAEPRQSPIDSLGQPDRIALADAGAGPVDSKNARHGRSVATEVSRRHLLMLLALSAIWGASFMFIKIGVRELAPTTLVCVRLGIGALTLLPLALVRLGGRETVRQLRAVARPLVATGLVNSAIPIVAISWAEKHIDSGLTAVIQASAPLFTALLALRFSRSERVGGVRLAGLLVGFGGVALLVGAQPSGDLLAACAVVFAALCYAVAALYAARRLVAVSPIVSSFGALAAASLALVPFAAAQLPGRMPSLGVTAAVLALGIGGTGFAYVLYYALLAGAGASRSILVTYLVPALALGYGAVFLGEAITAPAVGGLVLVLAGVALGTGAVRFARRRRPGLASAE
jgi:drug/metabolite transporter (DMT)-like permease